jgi:hypothetical protein
MGLVKERKEGKTGDKSGHMSKAGPRTDDISQHQRRHLLSIGTIKRSSKIFIPVM